MTLPAKIHQFLRMDRVKPSYRYNRYLKYPALGFNGGVAMAQDGDVHTLTTTWSPRYVLPRIVPVAHGVDLNIARLSQPDCLERLAPLLPAYEKWLEVTALRPVGKGLEGPKAAEQQQAEEAQLQQDLLEWKAELGAIRSGLAILEESRKHWSGPGPQKSRLGVREHEIRWMREHGN